MTGKPERQVPGQALWPASSPGWAARSCGLWRWGWGWRGCGRRVQSPTFLCICSWTFCKRRVISSTFPVAVRRSSFACLGESESGPKGSFLLETAVCLQSKARFSIGMTSSSVSLQTLDKERGSIVYGLYFLFTKCHSYSGCSHWVRFYWFNIFWLIKNDLHLHGWDCESVIMTE